MDQLIFKDKKRAVEQSPPQKAFSLVPSGNVTGFILIYQLSQSQALKEVSIVTTGEMLKLINRMKGILNGPADQVKPRLDAFIQDLTLLMDVIKDPTLNQLYCTVIEERYLHRKG